MKLTTNLSDVIRQLEQYRNTLHDKMRLLLEGLATIGVDIANVSFGSMHYDGDRDVSVGPVWLDDHTLALSARGKDVLFMEFGSGALYGDGHPQAKQFGYGPGTWSDNEALGGKGHWDDPNGWYYRHGEKSWGNPPAMAMHDAAQKMRAAVTKTAREVFGA